MTEKTKVAVLGGGAAGMTAAFRLTATKELREQYEVTVHQLGWRNGGKGASGRNRDRHDRIEEHGLHIWFGFYDNAFRTIRDCYQELGRKPSKPGKPGQPLATWTEAFHPCDQMINYEHYKGRWIAREFDFPRNPRTPGTAVIPSMWPCIHQALVWIHDEWERIKHGRREIAVVAEKAPRAEMDRGLIHEVAHDLDVVLHKGFHMLKAAVQFAGARAEGAVTEEAPVAGRMLASFRDWLWKHVVADRVDDDELRMLFYWVDFAAAIVTGILEDELWAKGFGTVNDEEWRHWLKRHGCSDLTLKHAPMIMAVYDAAFCYEDGNKDRPNVAAGKATQDVIRSVFFYKGAIMWKMQAGMGDTIFAPMYEVLRERGVKFEFFHAVDRLRVSGTTVETIDVIPQATVKAGDYLPLYDVDGLPCWPSEPLWEQLKEGKKLEAMKVDLEQDVNPLKHKPIPLRRGEHFDEVVLAIPVGAQLPLCEEVGAASPRYKRMLDHSSTVMTQAFQLWLHRSLKGEDWPYESESCMSCYVEPLDTYCNMSHLLPRESWTATDKVHDIAYFCGVLPHRGVRTQDDANQHAHDNAVSYLQSNQAGEFWPRSTKEDGSFAWTQLYAPASQKGAARFDSQYWRGNFSGTERYVQCPAGSVKYRLRADESGIDNLWLAGDWTRNGIDGGSVEAAVTSGIQAALAVMGESIDIQGTTGWLSADTGEARAKA